MGKRSINEKALIAAALREFSRNSYEEASVNRIIASAGIPKGSFYYRYRNKYELYISLLRKGSRLKWDYITAQLPAGKQDSKTSGIFDTFMLQAELGIRFANQHPDFHKLAVMFSKEKGSEIYGQALKDLGRDDQAGLSGMIDEAFSRGEFSGRYSREFIRRLLIALFTSFDEIFFRDGDANLPETEAFLREFTDFMKHGLSPQSGSE